MLCLCINKKYKSKSPLYNQLSKLVWECGISLTASAFKKGLKWTVFRTMNFVQGSGEAQAVWKKKQKTFKSKSILYTKFMKLIW